MDSRRPRPRPAHPCALPGLAFLGLLLLLTPGPARAAEPTPAPAPPSSVASPSASAPDRPRRARENRRAPQAALTSEALRILSGECLACHNDQKHRGGLNLATREALLAGGDSGPAVVPGNPAQSRLLQVLGADADPHMPPKKQLTPEQVDQLQRWVAAGAPGDDALLARLAGPREARPGPPPPDHQPVLALALAPDGSRLAVGRGRSLLIVDTASTNRPVLRETLAHQDLVRSLAWSPDGRRLASGSYRELAVRDAETLEPVWTASTNLSGRISALRFTPFGGALVAADGSPGEPGWIRLLASASGSVLGAWAAHQDAIADLALSPDGGLLATAGADRLVKTWELLTRQETARFEGHAGAVTGVAFNLHATHLVSVGADRQLKLWDTRTREAVVTVGGRRFGLNAVAWSADGSRVAVGDDEGRLLAFTDFKHHTGEQSSATVTEKSLGQWPGPLHAVAVSADGRTLYAGSQDGTVRVLDAEGRTLATLAAPAPAPTPAAAPASPALEPTPAAVPSDAAPAMASASDSDDRAERRRRRRAARRARAQAASAELAPAPPAIPENPSFVHDVLPWLAKSGCSAGSCHAKADGQNGFKLSVFSYDPAADFAEIVGEGRGRRIFPGAPEHSLLLLKPTGRLEHGGGRRLDPDSPAYQTLLRWIRGGMIYQRPQEPSLTAITVDPKEGLYTPGATRPLRVEARYSDGSTRDVTALAEFLSNEKEIVQVDDRGILKVGSLAGEGVVVARFMGLVDASRVTVPAARTLPEDQYARLPTNSFIDVLAHAQFRKLGLFPSAPCTDAEFLRRASLDTLGVLPTAGETRAFLALGAAGPDDDAAQQARRAALVDRLLERPEFADTWANKWADLVRPNPDRVGVKSVYVLDQWLRQAFRENRGLDRLARDFLLAEGSNHRDGPAVVYRDRREPSERTTLFSQIFLGIRMECARCHHHPNEKWSQDDFYRFAAFFGPLKQKGAGLSPPISAGTETFYHAPGGSVRNPVTGVELRPQAPDGPALPEGHDPAMDPRQALADWVTDPANPFFARAQVNRVWASFFGRGFVEPVDDFRVSNPASNEPLLDALARDFAAHGYDLKHLIRRILTSRLYQLGSEPNEFNLADTRNFSRAYRRRLPAEVLLDAVNDLTGVPDEFNGCPPGTRALQTWSYKVQSQFLDAFGRPNPSSDCPCERDLRTSVVQALHLMNSRRLHEKLASPDGRVRRLAEDPRPAAALVEELYLATLGRPPSLAEHAHACAAFSAPGATRQTAAEDVLWSLLNSPEFVFNH